ncbi:hypothetical protein G6N74_08140 [Mesorhizobium sp. CGMCC 1.15528]|uniref:Uncharacterized protein n=1 Tax=Mesorhizobium zhangyense TaxID=1776730 RepID=A0A7C9VBA8_9HYPH|nr:hypothetical protein [Mesorhizobium zhangyense]NGN41030.1 hypothetical protein [Mesorhizobium zhangyense]
MDEFDQNSKPISTILLNQRYRNHIIEYLEWVSSYQLQRDYQKKVPLVHVPHEAFNQWEDFASDEILQHYMEPVFSREEQSALDEYRRVLAAIADETPQILPALEELIGTEVWERMRLAAERAYKVLMRRGLFDWNVEQFPAVDET